MFENQNCVNVSWVAGQTWGVAVCKRTLVCAYCCVFWAWGLLIRGWDYLCSPHPATTLLLIGGAQIIVAVIIVVIVEMFILLLSLLEVVVLLLFDIIGPDVLQNPRALSGGPSQTRPLLSREGVQNLDLDWFEMWIWTDLKFRLGVDLKFRIGLIWNLD